MALPVLNNPTYELVLPSSGKKVKYRPFLVKEQKILMMAQESNNDDEIANAMSNLIKSSTFGKIDVETSPMFDVEYIFLNIRAKSAGETVELMVTCPDDEKTKVKTKINLQNVNVQMTAEHTNEIKIDDKVKMVMRYPVLRDMKNMTGGFGDNDYGKVFKILNRCIHEIHWGEKIYNQVDITEKELDQFVESMTNEQLESVMDFFNTMPKLRHVVKVNNPNTKVTSEVIVEGLQNFLE